MIHFAAKAFLDDMGFGLADAGFGSITACLLHRLFLFIIGALIFNLSLMRFGRS